MKTVRNEESKQGTTSLTQLITVNQDLILTTIE
jgi:hypothetical protein